MSRSLRRMDSFPIRDVRTTSEYTHLRYCYPEMTHEDIVKKLLPIQRMCFLEDDIRSIFIDSFAIPKTAEGIYDIWLCNLRNVSRISFKVLNTHSNRKRSILTLYETEVHPSETSIQIPLSFPESPDRVQMCFKHFLRDGSINLSFLPLMSLARKLAFVIELNEGGRAHVHLSTVRLTTRNKWYLATHVIRFYVAGKPYIVTGGKVQKYEVPSTRPWWERIIPLFGLRVHQTES